MWQFGECPTVIAHVFTGTSLFPLYQLQSQSLLLCMYLICCISCHCHRSWKPTTHARVLGKAKNSVNFLFLKHCSLHLYHLFFQCLCEGLPDWLPLPLGTFASLGLRQAPYFSKQFYFPRSGITNGTSSIRYTWVEERYFCSEPVGFPRGFAGERWPRISPWQMTLLPPWRSALHGTCIMVLAGSSLPLTAPPALDEVAGQLSHAC